MINKTILTQNQAQSRHRGNQMRSTCDFASARYDVNPPTLTLVRDFCWLVACNVCPGTVCRFISRCTPVVKTFRPVGWRIELSWRAALPGNVGLGALRRVMRVVADEKYFVSLAGVKGENPGASTNACAGCEAANETPTARRILRHPRAPSVRDARAACALPPPFTLQLSRFLLRTPITVCAVRRR